MVPAVLYDSVVSYPAKRRDAPSQLSLGTTCAAVGPVDHNKPSNSTTTTWALYYRQAHLRLWLTAFVGFVVDRASKIWAIGALGNPNDGTVDPLVIIDDYLCLRLLHNPGAVAGWFAGQTMLLILASAAAVAFLFWLFASSDRHQRLSHFAVGMLFSGALGNMYDRVFNHGKVIDFIEVDLHFWPANPWPIFNAADAFLSVGVVVLLVSLLPKGRHKAKH